MSEGTDIIQKAREFAQKAHEGQFRWDEVTPYFTHVEAVANLVRAAGGDDEMIAAAYLHDVVEDCGVKIEDLYELFGPRVTMFVQEMTNRYTKELFPNLNRNQRKALEVQHRARMSPETLLIKFCDILHNAGSINEEGESFGNVWRDEAAMFFGHVVRRIASPP